ITIDYQRVDAGNAQGQFKEAARAGTAPDLMRSEVAWTSEFASLGYLQPLDQTPLASDKQDYLAPALASNEFQGQLWGVPQVTDAAGLLCNKALLAKAKLSVPKSWDDIKKGAPAMLAAGATYIYAPVTGYFTLPYIYSMGGDMLNTTTKKVTINDPKAVSGFQRALDLIKDGGAHAPTYGGAYTQQVDLFKQGKIGCIVDGPWAVSDILAGPAFTDPANLTVNVIPDGTVRGSSPLGGQNLVVYAGSDNKESTYLFAEFLNSTQSQVAVAESDSLLPTRKSAYQQLKSSTAPRVKFVTDFQPVMDRATERPWIPELGLAYASMDEQWVRMYTGQATAQQGADAMANAWLVFLPSDYTDG
ncbi:MAG: extracellular solute-binding protein, partial [Candidatus Nanopelagicales bacterium]